MALDISPLTPARYTIRLAEGKRSELEGVTQQIAGGEKYRNYSGYAEEGTLQSVLTLDQAVGEAEGFIRSNKNAGAKLDVIDTAFGSLQGTATELSNLIVNRSNGASGENIPVPQLTDALLGRIADALNSSSNGKYIFGGSKTDRPPVTDDVFNISNVADGVAGANYYQGDAAKLTVRHAPGQELEYGVNADAQAFRDLIGAAHLLLEGHEKNDDETLTDALDLVNKAVSGLASERASVRGNKATLEEVNIAHEDLKLLLEANFDETTKTDIVEASTRLSELEATVQASFNAWSRLNRLRLSDYI